MHSCEIKFHKLGVVHGRNYEVTIPITMRSRLSASSVRGLVLYGYETWDNISTEAMNTLHEVVPGYCNVVSCI